MGGGGEGKGRFASCPAAAAGAAVGLGFYGGRGAALPLPPVPATQGGGSRPCPPAGRDPGARSEVVVRRVTCPILTYPYLLAILLASGSPPVIRTAQWLV